MLDASDIPEDADPLHFGTISSPWKCPSSVSRHLGG